MTVLSWKNQSGLTERVSFTSYTDSAARTHVLAKAGVTGRHGIMDGKKVGPTNDGHLHWVSKTSQTGKPGFRDDLSGTGQRVGLTGDKFPGKHGAPHASVSALQKATSATSQVVSRHADTAAATAKAGDWSSALKTQQALQAQVHVLGENTVSLKGQLSQLGRSAKTGGAVAAVKSARTAVSAAEKANSAARVAGENAAKTARVAGEQSARATRVAAEESAKVARAATDQAKQAAQVAAEEATKAARVAAEQAAHAARVAAETAATTARVAAETSAKAAAAVAGAAIAVATGGG